MLFDRKKLLDVRTAITNLDLDEDFYFNESVAKDILLITNQARPKSPTFEKG